MKPAIFFLFIALLPTALCAQNDEKTKFPLEKFYVERKKNPVSFLKNFHIGLSIGGGNTFMSHGLAGFGAYQVKGQQAIIFDSTGLNTKVIPTISQLNGTKRYSNWINDVNPYSDTIPTKIPISISQSVSDGKGNGLNIPLRLTLHYEYKQFRFGAGYSYELMALGSFNLSSGDGKTFSISPNSSLGFMSKYFGILGYSFYRLDKYLLTADLNIGNFSPGSNFNGALIQKGLYYNLGLTVERDLSEYFRVFARPSIEMKSYSINLSPSGRAIDHSMNAIYLNVGATYTIPELPRCYDPGCHAQINHAHGNREYRSRRHKIYEKQNPGYGENDPVLIKYRGKNRRKLNPY